MTVFDFNSKALVSFLKEHGLNPKIQEETKQPYIVCDIQGHEMPVFFDLREEGHLLQIIAYLPFQLKLQATNETARLLHMLNKELDMPGFGMEEKEGFVFYRAVIPCPSQKIDGTLFKRYLGTTRIICTTFLQAIKLLATGKIELEQLMNEERITSSAEKLQ